MKRILKVYSIALTACMLLHTATFAGDEPKVEKKKTYNKSYSVNSDDLISISNQFGEMRVNGWDRNEVRVDVTITAKANTEERAEEILDKISIEDGKNGNGVYFKTKWDNDKKDNVKRNKGDEHNNEGMTINYVVYLPTENPVDISNQFGAMIIPDLSGEAKIDSKFGSLDAGKLTNAKRVSIQFGHGEVESVHNGKLDFQFNNKDIVVRRITGDVDINVQHCKSKSVKLGVDNSIRSINLNNSFSDVVLSVPSNLSASYTVSTSHGTFANKSNFNIDEDDSESRSTSHGPKFNHKYSGNSGNGSSRIKISSSFGQVVLAHSMDVPVEKKSTEKKKKVTVI